MGYWSWLQVLSIILAIAWQGIFALSYYFVMKKLEPRRAWISLFGFVPWLGYAAILYVHFVTLHMIADRVGVVEPE